MDYVWTFDGVEIGLSLRHEWGRRTAELTCLMRRIDGTAGPCQGRMDLRLGTRRRLTLHASCPQGRTHTLSGVRLIGVRRLVVAQVHIGEQVHTVDTLIPARRGLLPAPIGADAEDTEAAAPLRLSLA